MRQLVEQGLAWRLSLARVLTAILLPPYSLRRVRGVMWRLGGVSLDLGVHICGGVLFAHSNATIRRGGFVGARTLIVPTASAPVLIGRHVAIGPDARIITVTHDIGGHGRRAGEPRSLPIAIEDGVWIGAGSTLMPGVTIGAGAVVAAGALVRNDVASDTLVAGVPARHVRDL